MNDMAGNRAGTVKKLSRRFIRETVFKLLFISEFNSEEEMKFQLEIYFDGAGSEIVNVLDGGIPDEEDLKFINEKFGKVAKYVPKIDAILNESSRGWKTERMSKVDLAILRLAVYEMLFDEGTPLKVAINEAVEIAKKFGGHDSGSFINGVLGKVAERENN